jgi:transcription-repair coupling factor (superfamily II helicase)
MNTEQLRKLYYKHPAFIDILEQNKELKNQKFQLKGLIGSSVPIFLSSIYDKYKNSFIIVLNDREEAAYFFDDLTQLLSSNDVLFFPSSFKRIAKHGKIEQENIVQRTEVLNRVNNNKKCFIVTYPDALLEKVITTESLKSNTLSISKNEKLSIEFVNDVLFEYGFERVDFVYEPGQYSVRGGIIDIYSFAHNEPFRIDFFGDEVESIRSFNIDTQLSIKKYDSISVIPNIQYGIEDENRIDFLSYLPNNFALAFRDIEFTSNQLDIFYNDNQKTPEDERLMKPELLCDSETFFKNINDFSTLD